MKTFSRGTTVRVTIAIFGREGTKINPDGAVLVSIWEQGNTDAVVEEVSMSKVTETSVGDYYYSWQTSGDSAVGFVRVLITAVHEEKTSLVERLALFSLI